MVYKRALAIMALAIFVSCTPALAQTTTGDITFSGSGTGVYELKPGNNVRLTNSNFGRINGNLYSAYDYGSYDGGGIRVWLDPANPTAAAAVKKNQQVGIMSGADYNSVGDGMYSTFFGGKVASTDVLLRYTYSGDANFDGAVDGDDFTQFLNGLNAPSTYPAKWVYGDFNFDGTVDGDDFTVFLTGLNTQGASFGWPDTAASAPASVPEPSTVVISILALAGILYLGKK